MPLISVIVPVYNVEKYLCKCVDSILKQTLPDFELILVDDGSKDDCPFICDKYARNDNRVFVVHQNNQGLSSARNRGLEVCKGDYITFVDSDDYLDPNYLETLYSNLIEFQCDMIICYCSFFDDENGVFQENEWIRYDALITKDNQKNINLFNFAPAWGKLYKREIFDTIRFPEGKTLEDEFILHFIIEKCKRIKIISKKLYFYRSRYGSIINSMNNKMHTISLLEILYERTIYFSSVNKDLYYYNLCYKRLFDKLVSKYKMYKKDKDYKHILSLTKKHYRRKKQKSFKHFVFYYFPQLYLTVFKHK